MLESMACGCPVIMGDIPQIREWITDGVNGYTCPTRDAEKLASCIQKIFEDKDGTNEHFVKYNLALVRRELDSEKMSSRIKELVVTISSLEGD
jgi:glycosyltransferase involved in cell wall biosynthesis